MSKKTRENDYTEKRKREGLGRKSKRKSKRLKYEPIEEDWGLNLNELDKIEELETARTRFLNSGPGLCKIGSGSNQTTIRVWSESELIATKILKECLDVVGQSDDIVTGAEGCKDKAILPEGLKKTCDLPKSKKAEKAQAPIVHFGTPSITKYFRREESINFDNEIKELEKQKR